MISSLKSSDVNAVIPFSSYLSRFKGKGTFQLFARIARFSGK
jgi:hypothetical protein